MHSSYVSTEQLTPRSTFNLTEQLFCKALKHNFSFRENTNFFLCKAILSIKPVIIMVMLAI